jgi:hypothetical protein
MKSQLAHETSRHSSPTLAKVRALTGTFRLIRPEALLRVRSAARHVDPGASTVRRVRVA